MDFSLSMQLLNFEFGDIHTECVNGGAELMTEHNGAGRLEDEEDRLSLSQVRISIGNSSAVTNGMYN